MIESILLTTTPIVSFVGQQRLTNATGFFFERDDRLFLVTSRHVLRDAPSSHTPDRVEIELHTDHENIAAFTGFSIPLYRHGRRVWRQGTDSAGEIDVAAIEVDRAALPQPVALQTFTSRHLLGANETVEIGTPTLIIGFPLGFQDQLHRTPVARQATLASSFGLRFQGKGYFLTDGRTHRGSSGAPVVMRLAKPGPARREVPWALLGVHSARLDVTMRDADKDEALGLNCAWYADILLTLTGRTPVVAGAPWARAR